MRVLFVAIGMEQLPVSLLSSILRRMGHEVGLAYSRHLFDDGATMSAPRLARLFADDDVVDQAVRFAPDVVCYSALSVTYQWMLDVAKQVKHLTGAVNVFGGVHASAVPEVVLEEPCVDFVCIGEGDIALPHLLEHIRCGTADRPMPNIAFRAPGAGPNGPIVRGPQLGFVQNLDALPGFEKDLWIDHVPVDAPYLTMSSRGCPYRCTFCFNNFWANTGGDRQRSGKYVRQRSVEHFVAELVEARRRYRIKYVDIQDDVFTMDAAWLREFARAYRRDVGVPFKCLTHVHFVNEEKVAALADAGCTWVQIGVQSVDDDYKRDNLRRRETSETVGAVLDLFHRSKIAVKTDHIFGFPEETFRSQHKAYAFYARHPGIKRISTFWLSYLPGTEMVNKGLQAGEIDEDDVDRLNRGECGFFHREAAVDSADVRQQFLAYEALLRSLPLLPQSVRGVLDVDRARKLPAPVLKLLGQIADVLGAVRHRNPDVALLVVRYLHGLEQHMRWRVGLPPRRRFRRRSTLAGREAVMSEQYMKEWARLLGAVETHRPTHRDRGRTSLSVLGN